MGAITAAIARSLRLAFPAVLNTLAWADMELVMVERHYRPGAFRLKDCCPLRRPQ